MTTWLQDILNAFANLDGRGHLSQIYKEIRKIRHEPLPPSYDAIIRREIEHNSSDSEAFRSGGNDLFFSIEGKGSGVWGVRSAFPISGNHTAVIDKEGPPLGNTEPKKYVSIHYRIYRDTNLTVYLKGLHDYTCQICATRLIVRNKPYAEAHHIRPLGSPCHGPDIASNILILCPNCHVKMDNFSLEINLSKIRNHKEHKIGLEFIEYNNAQAYDK